MRSRVIAPRQVIHALIVAGACNHGLGGLLCIAAQEHGLPAKGPGQAVKNAPTQTASPDSRSKLRAQRLATRKAKVAYEIAGLTREFNELAEEEYIEFIFPRELASIEDEIRLAESKLALAKEEFERGKKRLEDENRFFPRAQNVSEELAFKKAQFALEQAQSQRKVLVDYTRPKTIRAFQSDRERLRADEWDKRRAWEQERAKEAELVRQLNLT